MKFTLSWLKDHLDAEASLEMISETLTRIGLEVEGIEDKAASLKPYVVAHVLTAEQHPNADRLRVCTVDAGDGQPLQVVCGAPNARAGMKTVFAPPGTYVPGKNITLSVGNIRGVESHGMLCSGAELGLGEESDGILDLPDDAPTGQPYALYAKLDDPVIEINLTPNRPDCTSIHGIARDLAATGLGGLKREPQPPVRGEGACPVPVTLDLEALDGGLCPYFTLRLVRGVKNGPSPDWMQARLRAIGLRPINALVDITNYLTFDQGRPLHVFDAAKVRGGLVVRRARDGEALKALDGKTYTLTADTVVIADDSGVESIGGIIGGEASGCDADTVDVLIESALWDPMNIAQSGRRLGIITDARYRFERGVDPAFTLPGLDLATRLVLEICGGTPSMPVIVGEPPVVERVIDFPWTETRRLAGIELSRAEMKVTLEALGFHVAGTGDRVKVLTPSWRPDVEGKADLVEEIVRIAGLDRIEPKPLPRIEAIGKPMLTVMQKRTRLAKRALASHGLVEAVTWSFIPHDDAVLFGGGGVGSGAGQSDRRRPLGYAPEPDSRPASGRPAQRRPRERGCRPVRGRTVLRERPAGGTDHPGGGDPAGDRDACGRGSPLGRGHEAGRRVRRQGRCDGAAGRPRYPDRRPANRGRWTGLAASRPIRHAAVRTEESGRLLRRGASARAEGSRSQGPDRRLRNHPGRGAAAEIPSDQGQAGAGPVRLPADLA